MRAANCAEGEWLRKAKEDKRKKKKRKLQAWERRADTDSNGDDGDSNEVVNDIEWDDLENEDVLTSIGSSLQELKPFLFHGGEGTSGEHVEVGPTIGLP